MLKRFDIATQRQGMYNITGQIQSVVTAGGVKSGLCVVHCPHTTAGITINENADPDVQEDFLLGMEGAFPHRNEFRHTEGNSTAHLKSSSVGPSQTLIIDGGRLLLGRWQGIYFCEFDGPRQRQFHVKVMADRPTP